MSFNFFEEEQMNHSFTCGSYCYLPMML